MGEVTDLRPHSRKVFTPFVMSHILAVPEDRKVLDTGTWHCYLMTDEEREQLRTQVDGMDYSTRPPAHPQLFALLRTLRCRGKAMPSAKTRNEPEIQKMARVMRKLNPASRFAYERAIYDAAPDATAEAIMLRVNIHQASLSVLVRRMQQLEERWNHEQS